MDTLIYVALSQQTALRRQMDVVANNIANLNTTGYRRETVLFEKFLSKEPDETEATLKDVAFVTDAGIFRHNEQGSLSITNAQFDLAIDGKGYFPVRTPDGKTNYTRNGSFTLSDNGELMTASGDLLLSSAGTPIPITAEDREIKIARDGLIASQRGPIATLGLVEFDNDSALKKAGNNQYQTDQQAKPVQSPKIIQGQIEASNVNGILEMSQMINITRVYESTARLIEDYSKLRSRAINELARTS